MSKPLARSSGGCWTCRIRHRKCDEASPACKECTDRKITCYGYGREPEWIKNPSKLQEELQRIKHAVKQNFRRTRRLQAQISVPRPGRSPASRTRVAADTLNDPSASQSEGSEFREAELLTYYLDYIFPLQYAYYVDKPALGGRGWLFWLLSKKGPLRHAAFTLSALHQHTMSQSKTEEMQSELIRYHTNAMQELRQVLSQCETDGFASHPEYRVEFLTCGTFLISFEVFQGGISNWEQHLNALVLVAGQIDLESLDRTFTHSATPHAGFQRILNAAIRFHVSQLLWFDLLSCVSTGKPPKLPYQTWLRHDEIDISCVMGCQNWAMLALGDVALLETQVADINFRVLRRRVESIVKRLQDGINQSITRVFATTILLQLWAMSTSTEEFHEAVHELVADVIDSLQKIPKGVPLRGLPWPICVAGAMAGPDQRYFFEDLLEKILEPNAAEFTNCNTVLRILRESWHDSDLSGTRGPRDAMSRLGICALLI
ncbi:Transcriptional regulatory protein UME6 [Colletotrichum chlorophyti]|uniref:Transcriptional regulatory protein UME6 n=1 Tax=Colletotrichum chlorophyti TaxID=708187 RepID=A0A1Q8S5A0_9PEZI|nr:Transcriptional regulatory protein UME6 [Colletotrichum chlorophyti]